jgi:hypothetical protein
MKERKLEQMPFSFDLAVAEQVNEIRRGSISRLICDNADDVKSMQPRGFEQISQE